MRLTSLNRSIRLLTWLAPLGLCLLLAGLVEATTIQLRSRVVAGAGPFVRLGDVADIRSDDPELERRLQEIKLGPPAAEGRSTSFDFEMVRNRIQGHGIALTSLEFGGASSVTVETQKAAVVPVARPMIPINANGQKMLEDSLSKIILQHVQAQTPPVGPATVAVKLNSEVDATAVSAVRTNPRVTGGTAPWTGQQVFQVQFGVAGRRGELTVKCDVQPSPRVLAAKRNISKGKLIQADDLVWQPMPTDFKRGKPLVTPEDVLGHEAVRAVRENDPIIETDLRSVPLMRRGEIVTVRSRQSGIVVRMEARAQGDAGFGEEIRLVSLDRRHELIGRVTGYHEAEVIGSTVAAPGAADGTPTGVRLIDENKN